MLLHHKAEHTRPASRYGDTALTIHRQWQRLLVATFPTVANSAVVTANEMPVSL